MLSRKDGLRLSSPGYAQFTYANIPRSHYFAGLEYYRLYCACVLRLCTQTQLGAGPSIIWWVDLLPYIMHSLITLLRRLKYAMAYLVSFLLGRMSLLAPIVRVSR